MPSFFASLAIAAFLSAPALAVENSSRSAPTPPPPQEEPIEITTLTLPPVVPGSSNGSCTAEINPNGTGCILQVGGFPHAGGFLPDGKHVMAIVHYTGSPSTSIYNGEQLILVKVDGSFPNGDTWKCITCGVPDGRNSRLDYPQAFRDGRRILAGTNIIDCGEQELASDNCTPDLVHIYPIRWNTAPDGSGPGGAMRELRLHPDQMHIGFSTFGMNAGRLDQHSIFARLDFNPNPVAGTPLSPRYDLLNVTILGNDAPPLAAITTDGDQMHINHSAIVIGELRGFSGTGAEVTYVGYPAESSNIDVFAADLTTGVVRRLTAHPEYCDPVDISPDDKWHVIMDTRGSNRQMFMAGMRGIPPITDLVSTSASSSTRNNGARRFFQPYLLDHYGDRGTYFGQRINAAGDGSPGSINDREWNGRADPKWSFDGTKIVYRQALTIPPACGGSNPLPCQNSTEPGGRTERFMLAHLVSRKPLDLPAVKPASDFVPWGTPYTPGDTLPTRPYPAEGVYILAGPATGSARVTITENINKTAVASVSVEYANFSADGATFLNGKENVTATNPSLTLNHIDWFSDLVQSGAVNATKKTSDDGFHLDIDVLENIFMATGTLTTTIDGEVYKQPANGT